MRRIFYLITAVFLATLLLIPLTQSVRTAAGSGTLLPLTDLPSYSQWFEQQTGFPHDPAYFGAYALTPISDTLYIGFGAGRPADMDGSLLAQSDGVTITAVSTLTEQGFIGMTNLNGTLFIPGVDPCCDDDWTLGNTYVYTPASAAFTKFRNLPDVIHGWGLWVDADDGSSYTAVSFSPDGGDGGGVFRSTTQAQTWTKIAGSISGIGDNRTYDIIGLHNKLYVTWNDTTDDGPCGLAVSADGGQNWNRLAGLSTLCRPRLTAFQGNLLVLRDDRAALYTVDAAGTAVTHTLPFSVTDWAYNYATTDNTGNLYVVAADGRILRSADLDTWETAASTNLDLVTIAYWPARNWLIVGSRGSGAGLWYLDLTPTAARYVILMIADGWGTNQIAAAIAYSGSTPAYQSWPQTWMSTFPAGGSYDSVLAWTDFDYVLTGATDSAAAATAMYTGVKTSNGRVATNEPATQRLTAISEQARTLGWAVGSVSTVQLSHATPGAWIGHNDFRSNGYAIADEGLWGDPNTTGTTTDSPAYSGGHGPTLPPPDVIIGGGHPGWSTNNYVNSAIRDKLFAENGRPGTYIFAERIAGSLDGGERLLAAANLPTTTRLAGLFGGSGGNLEYRLADGSGHNPENPTLAQMTTAALTVLSRSPHGFVLMVEGGAVDWAGHANNMDQMIGELIGFNDAVQAVIDWVNAPDNGSSWENTLVIVTGDHETGYLTAGPGIFSDEPLGTVDSSTLALEKVITSTGRRASWQDTNGNDEIDAGETVYWAWNSANHSNSLVPLYARGVGANSFAGYTAGTDVVRGVYVDNTAVHHVMFAVIGTHLYLPLISYP
ncbi:MAG: alkaline phosphatase [Ardenticatenaceae bacterium]|nr:alkaline phosphatase [Ardenticatenaceae bacterium]MCB9446318.1 alkaline phosphatase [Ardenticatenaceae bacterium]